MSSGLFSPIRMHMSIPTLRCGFGAVEMPDITSQGTLRNDHAVDAYVGTLNEEGFFPPSGRSGSEDTTNLRRDVDLDTHRRALEVLVSDTMQKLLSLAGPDGQKDPSIFIPLMSYQTRFYPLRLICRMRKQEGYHDLLKSIKSIVEQTSPPLPMKKPTIAAIDQDADLQRKRLLAPISQMLIDCLRVLTPLEQNVWELFLESPQDEKIEAKAFIEAMGEMSDEVTSEDQLVLAEFTAHALSNAKYDNDIERAVAQLKKMIEERREYQEFQSSILDPDAAKQIILGMHRLIMESEIRGLALHQSDPTQGRDLQAAIDASAETVEKIASSSAADLVRETVDQLEKQIEILVLLRDFIAALPPD